MCYVTDISQFSNFVLDDTVTLINVRVHGNLLEEMGYDGRKTRELIKGFTGGFDIGYGGPKVRKDTSANIPITVGSDLDMWNKVMKEVEAACYAGPFEAIPYTESYMQSPIGLVPKAGGQTRLIFHLSYDFGTDLEDERKSLNFHTPSELCSVKYRDLDYAVQTCLHKMKLAEHWLGRKQK